jgi:hypothetical protein
VLQHAGEDPESNGVMLDYDDALQKVTDTQEKMTASRRNSKLYRPFFTALDETIEKSTELRHEAGAIIAKGINDTTAQLFNRNIAESALGKLWDATVEADTKVSVRNVRELTKRLSDMLTDLADMIADEKPELSQDVLNHKERLRIIEPALITNLEAKAAAPNKTTLKELAENVTNLWETAIANVQKLTTEQSEAFEISELLEATSNSPWH